MTSSQSSTSSTPASASPIRSTPLFSQFRKFPPGSWRVTSTGNRYRPDSVRHLTSVPWVITKLDDKYRLRMMVTYTTTNPDSSTSEEIVQPIFRFKPSLGATSYLANGIVGRIGDESIVDDIYLLPSCESPSMFKMEAGEVHIEAGFYDANNAAPLVKRNHRPRPTSIDMTKAPAFITINHFRPVYIPDNSALFQDEGILKGMEPSLFHGALQFRDILAGTKSKRAKTPRRTYSPMVTPEVLPKGGLTVAYQMEVKGRQDQEVVCQLYGAMAITSETDLFCRRIGTRIAISRLEEVIAKEQWRAASPSHRPHLIEPTLRDNLMITMEVTIDEAALKFSPDGRYAALNIEKIREVRQKGLETNVKFSVPCASPQGDQEDTNRDVDIHYPDLVAEGLIWEMLERWPARCGKSLKLALFILFGLAHREEVEDDQERAFLQLKIRENKGAEAPPGDSASSSDLAGIFDGSVLAAIAGVGHIMEKPLTEEEVWELGQTLQNAEHVASTTVLPALPTESSVTPSDIVIPATFNPDTSEPGLNPS